MLINKDNTILFKKVKKFYQEWIADNKFEEIQYYSTEVFINGKNLIDSLKAYENIFAREAGHPEIAGLYTGISPGDPLYVYKKLKDYSQTSLVGIFQCGDCMSGFCPFQLKFKIRKENKFVYWFDFQQIKSHYPFLGPPYIPAYGTVKKNSHNDLMVIKQNWDYSKFGPFQFTEANYNTSLRELKII